MSGLVPKIPRSPIQTESRNTSNGPCGIRDAMHEIFIKIPSKIFLVNLAELVFWRILSPL